MNTQVQAILENATKLLVAIDLPTPYYKDHVLQGSGYKHYYADGSSEFFEHELLDSKNEWRWLADMQHKLNAADGYKFRVVDRYVVSVEELKKAEFKVLNCGTIKATIKFGETNSNGHTKGWLELTLN